MTTEQDKILDMFRAMLNVMREDGTTTCRLGGSYGCSCSSDRCPFCVGDRCLMRALLLGNYELNQIGFNPSICIEEIRDVAIERKSIENNIFVTERHTSGIDEERLKFMKKISEIYQGLPDKYKTEKPVKKVPVSTDRFTDLDVNDHDDE